MAQLTKRYEVKLTEQQSSTLEKLREYKIVPSKFIRLAIKEKLERDYESILKKKSKSAKSSTLLQFIIHLKQFYQRN